MGFVLLCCSMVLGLVGPLLGFSVWFLVFVCENEQNPNKRLKIERDVKFW